MRLLSLPGVFTPIAESELLAATLREQTFPPEASVLDLCTGTGIAALAAARRGAGSVTAVDVSRRAVATVRLNALLNGVAVRAVRGDLYAPVGDRRFDFVVANPPYVPCGDDEVPRRGSARAWKAGRDGRIVLDRIVAGLADHLRPGGVVLLTHSSVLGVERTLGDLTAGGLDARVIARRRVPFGPVLTACAAQLEAAGRIAPGQRHEDVLVFRGRLPVRVGRPRVSPRPAGARRSSPAAAP